MKTFLYSCLFTAMTSVAFSSDNEKSALEFIENSQLITKTFPANQIKPLVPSSEYMPKGCISEKNGCCLITMKEYLDLVELARETDSPNVVHKAECVNGKRYVTQENVWPHQTTTNQSIKF